MTDRNTTNAKGSPGELYDFDLERMVLGSALNSYRLMTEVRPILNPDCFYHPDHREIFEVAAGLYDHGDTPEMVSVSQELLRKGSPVPPSKVRHMCAESTTKLYDLKHDALNLLDLSLRRRMYQAGLEMMTKSMDLTEQTETIHAAVKETVDGLFDTPQTGTLTLSEANRRVIDIMLANQCRPAGETFGSPTGFAQLDRNGGLCPGDLTVVGAETSQGKTSFATAMAVNAATDGDAVAFYSMEMTAEQLAARIAAMRSGVSASRILFSPLPTNDIYRVSDCMTMPEGAGEIYFDPKSRSTIESIVMSIRAMKMRHGIKGVVVDYLQLVTVSDKSLNREQATAKCARDLKNIAKELDIWVVAISQLSRDRNNPLPSLSRLRDSGQIEEAADNIILLYRPRDGKPYPDEFAEVSTEGTALVTVAKGRNVGLTRFVCGFRPENTLFYPLEEGSMPMAGFRFKQRPADDDIPPY